MMLHVLLCFILIVVLTLNRIHAQESIMENVCNGVFDLLDETCSKTISIPTGVEVEYKKSCTNNCCEWDCGQCTNNCCEWDCGQCTNNCCTWSCGQPFGVPCSGCSKQHCGETCVPCSGCSKEQCGETCVPCTGCSKQHCGETCVDIPDTLKLVETEYSLCDLAEETIPGINAVQEAAQWCPCLSQVTKYISEGLLDKIEDVEYNEATTLALGAVGDIVDCVADHTTSIDSEKDVIIANAEESGGIVLFGPEIGLQQYTQFVGAVGLCAVSGKCEDILTLMKDIFVDTTSIIGTNLIKELRRYYVDWIFGPVGDTVELFTDIETSFDQVAELLVPEVESCAQEITDEAREDLEALKVAYHEAETLAISKMKELEELGVKMKDAANAVGGAIDALESAFDALDTPFITQISEFFESGKTPELYEAAKFLAENQDIQTVLDAAKAGISFLQSLEQHVNDVEEQVRKLETASTDLLNFEACDFDSDVTGQVDWFVSALKGVASELLGDIEEAVKYPIDGIAFDYGLASYSSKWTIKITNLPCSKLDRQTFTSDLCPGCSPIVVDVPEFYPCSYEMTIPLPKEHTPYLRLNLPSNDL